MKDPAKKYNKAEVKFEHPAEGMNHCQDCRHFTGWPAGEECDIVRGVVKPQDWCNKWKKK